MLYEIAGKKSLGVNGKAEEIVWCGGAKKKQKLKACGQRENNPKGLKESKTQLSKHPMSKKLTEA